MFVNTSAVRGTLPRQETWQNAKSGHRRWEESPCGKGIMNIMIPKSSKFPTRVQFLQLRSIAKQITTPHLRILFHSRSVNNITLLECDSRLSVIVPIKVSKRATTRNSFKRFVYDTAWKILKDKNLDCIIIFKPLPLVKGKPANDLIASELNGLKFDN